MTSATLLEPPQQLDSSSLTLVSPLDSLSLLLAMLGTQWTPHRLEETMSTPTTLHSKA